MEEWGFDQLVPRRKYSGGVRPGLSSGEMFVSKNEYREEKSKWLPISRQYNVQEMKKMIAKMFEIGVRECFRNHMYRFKGRYFVFD